MKGIPLNPHETMRNSLLANIKTGMTPGVMVKSVFDIANLKRKQAPRAQSATAD